MDGADSRRAVEGESYSYRCYREVGQSKGIGDPGPDLSGAGRHVECLAERGVEKLHCGVILVMVLDWTILPT